MRKILNNGDGNVLMIVGLKNYTIHRRDKYAFSNVPYEDGVLIALHKNLQFSSIYSSRTINIKQLLVGVSTTSIKEVIGVVYLHLRTTNFDEKHVEYIECVKNVYIEHDFVILGECNLSSTWSNSEEGSTCNFSSGDQIIQCPGKVYTLASASSSSKVLILGKYLHWIT